MEAGEGYRCTDAQRAGQAHASSACLHLRVLGCVDRGLRPFIEPLAGLGWGQTACGADEQSYTQLRLELCDGLRHGRLSDLHPAGGRGKRAALDHAHESLHRAESVHFPYVSTVEAYNPTPRFIDAVDREFCKIMIANMEAEHRVPTAEQELKNPLDVNVAVSRHLARDELFGAIASCLRETVKTDRLGIDLPIDRRRLQG